MSSSGETANPRVARLEAAARALAEAADEVLAEEAASAQLSDVAVQRILTAGTRLFARKAEIERRDFSPFTSANAATATEAVTVMGGMLQAVNLSVFDLSMWVDGRPRV